MQMNFKTYLLAALGWLGYQSAYAQWQYMGSDTLDTNQVGSVIVFGQANLNSNTLVNDFLYGFTDGRYVEPSTIDRMTDKSADRARLGADVDFGAEYRWRTRDSINNQWVRFADRQHYHLVLNDDYLGLILQGNGAYRGEELQAEDNQAYAIRYQQLQYGRSLKKDDYLHQFAISLLNAEYLTDIQIDQSSFYTDPDGDFWTLGATGQMIQSDTSNRQLLAHNGVGVSVDYRLQKDLKNDLRLNFDLLDLGVVCWYNKTMHTPFDTVFTFNGVDVGNYFTAFDRGPYELPFDSLRDDIAEGSYKEALWAATPFTTHASMTKFREGQEHRLGVIMKFFAGYTPQVYYSYMREKDNWIYGASLRYGGYGNLSAGLQAGARFDQFTILLSSNSFESLLLPKSTGANSFNFRLTYSLLKE